MINIFCYLKKVIVGINIDLRYFCFYLLILSGFYNNSYAIIDPYPKNEKVDILNYIFDITLSDSSDLVKFKVTIDLRVLDTGVEKIRLDLVNTSKKLGNKGMTVNEIKSSGSHLNFVHEQNELWIKMNKILKINDRIKLIIFYEGIPFEGLQIGQNKYGDRTFFSDNWPNKGRHWLATVDHPYDKATCEFIVTAPNHYQVISNGLKIEETNLERNQKKTHWKQSIPIATWLYVLGVAEFAVQYVDEFDGKSIQTWVFKQDRDAGFYDFAEPTKKALEFYSDNIGPYSYEKLANIQSNSVSGGMEAASAILYSANSVKGDRNNRWRNVVIHEIAHQWFGNSVTEYDWDDVWLSEGFATYFTLLFIEHQYGYDEFMKGLKLSKDKVDSFHKKNPNYTIIHDNLKNMNDVTSSQTYQKGSWVLHMLRGILGDEFFWQGIKNYYSKFKDLNATTEQFRIVMEEVSDVDLSVFFKQWLYRPGSLKLNGNWKFNNQKKEINLTIEQIQNGVDLIEMPIEIGVYFDKSRIIKKINLKEKKSIFNIKLD
ncbi:MAG: M1 family metallopeptidase, partial [Flavobacteriaceae bacterium]